MQQQQHLAGERDGLGVVQVLGGWRHCENDHLVMPNVVVDEGHRLIVDVALPRIPAGTRTVPEAVPEDLSLGVRCLHAFENECFAYF